MTARVSRLLLTALLLAGSARSAEIQGRIELLRANGSRAVDADASEAVVYFEPASHVPPPPAEGELVMATVRKSFEPTVLVVQRGSRVRFPNFDPILHNVFSISPGNRFDLGLYGREPGKVVTFDTPGLVRVFCNVHNSMYAHILVVDTPYFTHPDSRGNFLLEEVPAGHGSLVLWHERADFSSQSIDAPATVPLAFLKLSKRQIPPHLNKFGRPYGRARRDRYN